MHSDPRAPIRLAAYLLRKHLRPEQELHDVLARPERVRLEIRASAVRLASRLAAKGDTVALATDRARYLVVRPRCRRIGRSDLHPLRPCSLGPLLERLAAQAFFIRRPPNLSRGAPQPHICL